MSIPRSCTTVVDYDRDEGTEDDGNEEGEARPSRTTSPGNGRRPPLSRNSQTLNIIGTNTRRTTAAVII